MSTDTQQRGLTPEQLTMLLTPLQPGRVRQQQGQFHLEAWDVRRWLTRIFGFGGWNEEILTCECVHSITSPVMDQGKPHPLKNRCTAVYKVTMRLVIKDQHGNEMAHYDEGATGDSVNQPSVGDAHDMALKTALSQALKRCATNLGDQFGLSLYNKGETGGVVGRTLGHPALTAGTVAEVPQDAPVTGGELDEQREAPAGEPQHAVAAAVVRKAQDEQPARGIIDEPSQAQHKMLNALLTKKFGRMPNGDRYVYLSQQVGRAITSSSELTKRDVSKLIDGLQSSEETPQDPPGQDFHLPSDIGPEGICSGLVDAMAAAVDTDALTALGKRVADLKTKGILHEEHLGRLTAAWNARQLELGRAA